MLAESAADERVETFSVFSFSNSKLVCFDFLRHPMVGVGLYLRRPVATVGPRPRNQSSGLGCLGPSLVRMA